MLSSITYSASTSFASDGTGAFDGSAPAQKPNGLGVVLLRYPANFTESDPDFPLVDDVHANDLDQYQQWWPGGNAMYWWSFAAGYRDLEGRAAAPGPRRNASAAAVFGSAADAMFAKSTAQNVYGPFKIWAESQGGGGCPNFLSGAGGWLQSVALLGRQEQLCREVVNCTWQDPHLLYLLYLTVSEYCI